MEGRLKIRNPSGFSLLFSKPQLLLSIRLNKIKVITIGIMMPSQILIIVNLSSKLFQELGTMLGIHTVYHILLV